MRLFYKRIAIHVLVALLCFASTYVHRNMSVGISVPQGMSLLLCNKENSGSVWHSDSENIATVARGVVYAKSVGEATITSSKILAENPSNSSSCTYKIKVTKSSDLKTISYISEGHALMFYAITSNRVKDVKIQVDKEYVISVKNKKEVGEDIFWEIAMNINSSGKQLGHFIGKVDLLIGPQWLKSVTTVSGLCNIDIDDERVTPRSASKNLIQLIAKWEGFCDKIEEDSLVTNVFNIGNGRVINCGETFYNNISKEHAFVDLVNKINSGKYTADVNNFIVSNKIKCNQQQFDALVSFSYNLGTGWLKKSKLRDLLLEARDPKTNELCLAFLNRERFAREWLEYHHVSNPRRCVPGLLYRRINELNVFFDNNYCSTHNNIDKYEIYLPKCLSSKVLKH